MIGINSVELGCSHCGGGRLSRRGLTRILGIWEAGAGAAGLGGPTSRRLSRFAGYAPFAFGVEDQPLPQPC